MEHTVMTRPVLEALVAQFGSNNVKIIEDGVEKSFIICELTIEQLQFLEETFNHQDIGEIIHSLNSVEKELTKEELIEEAFKVEEAEEDVADMLGLRYMDNISGLVGDVIMIGQTLSGSVEALIQPKCLVDNILPESHWVQIDRLTKV